MAVQVVPYALQNASHSAAVFRQAQSAPFVSGGVLSGPELAVTPQSTPNMTVILGAGRAQVPGTSVSPPSGLAFTTQAMYHTLNDAPLTLTVSTSDPTNPRIDAVYLQVQDSYYSGASNMAVAGIAVGAPAVTPVAPSIPSNAVLLAYIAVAANATTIVAANLSDKSTVATLLPQADTGWLPIGAYSNGFTAGSGVPSYRVIGGICYLRGTYWHPTTAPASLTAQTLPVGARPSSSVLISTYPIGSSSTPTVIVSVTGQIIINSAQIVTASTGYSIDGLSFPVN
jgi:hypothetical protein